MRLFKDIIWTNDQIPKYKRVIEGLVQILEGLVRVLSFGYCYPMWHCYYISHLLRLRIKQNEDKKPKS